MILLHSWFVSKDVEQSAAYREIRERTTAVCSLEPFFSSLLSAQRARVVLSPVGVKQHTTAEHLASSVLVCTKNTPESSLDITQLCSP